MSEDQQQVDSGVLQQPPALFTVSGADIQVPTSVVSDRIGVNPSPSIKPTARATRPSTIYCLHHSGCSDNCTSSKVQSEHRLVQHHHAQPIGVGSHSHRSTLGGGLR